MLVLGQCQVHLCFLKVLLHHLSNLREYSFCFSDGTKKYVGDFSIPSMFDLSCLYLHTLKAYDAENNISLRVDCFIC